MSSLLLRYHMTFIDVEELPLEGETLRRAISCPPRTEETARTASGDVLSGAIEALENEEVYRLQVERLVARAEVLPKHSPDMTAETAAETEEVTAETDEGEATEVTEMDTDDEALPSLGSWGHPELCRRPCVFWVKQQSCAAGANCNFCHLEHQKLVCLDKKQRIIMADLTDAEKSLLILPHVRLKVEEGLPVEHLLHLLEREAQAVADTSPNAKDKANLNKA
ncbi:C3H1-type domain-containing protein, partial [Durusdinium trenchii]